MCSPRTICRLFLLLSGLTLGAVPDCVVDASTGAAQSPFEAGRPSVQRSDEPSVRTFPFVSEPACADIVRVALETAATRGWTTNHHKNYATTDLDVRAIPRLWALVGPHVGMLERNLSLSEEYGAAAIEFHDVFLVRYAEDGQRALDLHEDGSRVTFQLALNAAQEDFQDGGTWFEDMGCRLQPDLGHAMTFHGGLKHAGLAISSGQRFVLVGFSQPHSEDDQNTHASFGLPYNVSLAVHTGDPTGFRGPCREIASPESALHASISWHGCEEDVFTVASSIRGTARWLWLTRESGQRCTFEALHQLSLRLLFDTSPSEVDLLHLLQLPPDHEYEAVPLEKCRGLDV